VTNGVDWSLFRLLHLCNRTFGRVPGTFLAGYFAEKLRLYLWISCICVTENRYSRLLAFRPAKPYIHLRGQLVLGEGCCSSARDPFGSGRFLLPFTRWINPQIILFQELRVHPFCCSGTAFYLGSTSKTATFPPDRASHECVAAATLKRVVTTQGESWLDREFWK